MNQNLCALRVLSRGSVELSDMMAGSYANKALFKSNLVSRKSKLKLYWPVIRPIVVYGCETWVCKENIQKLSVFERKILRKIFGPTKEWRIKTSKELDELIKHRNIINYVKAQRLSSFGHTNRMPKTSIVKRLHKWKPFTGKPAGRPKSRWDDDVRNDLKKMKLVKWAEQVQDHSKWKGIVEKAKAQSCSATEEEEDGRQLQHFL